MGEVRITSDSKHVLTTALAAERYNVDPTTMRKALSRLAVEPVDHLDARTPLYLATDLDRAMAKRPGRGAGGGRPKTTSADQPR